MTEVEQLVEEWVVLDRAVEELRDAMSQHRNSVTINMIGMCGSRAWNDQRSVERQLQRKYVRAIGYKDGVVRYSLRGVVQVLRIDEQEIAAGVERYMDRIERMLEKREDPGRT